MSRLKGRRVLLGVGGGIAAYKAPELVRALQSVGAEVRVVMTASASEFVAPLTLEVLSGQRVGRDLFDPTFEHEIGHIELARWCDVVLVAPATANLIARARVGMADDLLTTVLLATRAPVVFSPAMNSQMLAHPAVVENLEALRAREGVTVVDPDSGSLACGEVGAGRQPDFDVLLAALERALPGGGLRGVRVGVTAGPTREYFDPVRFLSNPSSGRMGFALASSAAAEGGDVTLISGPCTLATPPGVRRINVVTASDMRDAALALEVDVLLMCAAVADWRPARPETKKRKKEGESWSPELARTADVLRELASSERRPRFVVGFAAETDDLLANAEKKLADKKLDAIVANDVSSGLGFESASNTVTILGVDGSRLNVGPAPKRAVADAIVRWVAERISAS